MSNDKGKEILAKLKATRGFTLPHHAILARDNPDFLEALLNYTSVLEREGAISQKVKQLIVISLDASTGYETGVRSHLKRAVELGATRNEIMEAFLLATYHDLAALALLPVVDKVLTDMGK